MDELLELKRILSLRHPRQQDDELYDWIALRILRAPAASHLFGRQPTGHRDFDDVMVRILAHLLRRTPPEVGITAFEQALINRPELDLSTRAYSVLIKTLYQEFYKHKRATSPAFSRFREQIRYAVKEHGCSLGLLISRRSYSMPECIIRKSFQRRTNARVPNHEDLLRYVTPLELLRRGSAKVAVLDQLLSRIERESDFQPLLPVNILAHIYASQLESQSLAHDEFAANSDDSPDNSSDTATEMVRRARVNVSVWLEQSYFKRIGADGNLREALHALHDRYVERWLADGRRRTASKDILLEQFPHLAKSSHEASRLMAYVHYICARFRKEIKSFQQNPNSGLYQS